ncbi:MAG: hypothetical protein E7031_02640 [Akkermansiaceae bacterium]|nr:hypothetical protein [Akkermansiaceae bacterium]
MKNYNLYKLLSVILLTVLSVLVTVQNASAAPEPTARRGAQIQVTFRNIPAEDKPNVDGSYIVSQANGCITLPYIEETPIKADGKTASQLERMIKNAYLDAKIYKHPIVSVQVASVDEINDINKRYVQVSGFVARKQNLPYRQGLTLIGAILDCGDITDYGSREIQVTRYNAKTGKTHTQTYDYFSARDRSLKLQPNDVIFVKPRGPFEGRPSELLP